MSLRAFAVAVVLLLECASPTGAQQSIKLEFENGRVSLSAQNASSRAILAEWARLGGATILNGDRVIGAPVTLEFIGVPERQALDTLLRGVAAYVLAPRRAGGQGASTFDRILILPTSTVERNPAAPTNASPTPGPPVRPRLQVPINPNVSGEVPSDSADGDAQLPADLVSQPGAVRPPEPILDNGVGIPARGPAANEPVGVGSTPPSAGNPFGIPAGSSSRPGVIAPIPVQPTSKTPPQQR